MFSYNLEGVDMAAGSLPNEMVDSGIQLKGLLSNEGFEAEARSVDFFLCQYDYVGLQDKEELIDSMLITLNRTRCAETRISDETSQCTEGYVFLLSDLKNKLEEIHNIRFRCFRYNDKEYLVDRDVFDWIITENQIIFLINENGEVFEDNLVALNTAGEVIWDSRKWGEGSNRIGAAFVALRPFDETTVIANAYAGFFYFADIKTGKIKDMKFAK